MHIAISRALAALLIGVSGLAGCMIPYIVRLLSNSGTDLKARRDAIDSRLCLCNCLGAGIVMGMSFLHILPESVSQYEHSNLLWHLRDGSVNPAYFTMLMSFLGMLFLERVLSSGRTPCSAAFNDCPLPNACCGPDDAMESCTESGRHRSACDMESHEEAHETKRECNYGTFGSRFRHHHLKVVSALMKVLCPLCECNGLCITLALFIHSLFEGIVVGLADSHWNLWLITAGIILHKWAAGMALSSFVAGNSKLSALIMQTIFCLGSPFGILIGGLTSGTVPSAEAILNSIAVGTLLYIGMEIITHELFCHMHCRKTAFLKWLCVFLGTMLIFMTAIFEVYMNGGRAHSHASDVGHGIANAVGCGAHHHHH